MVARALVVVPIVLTVTLYSLYFVTALHPRFFFVVLPLVFVLDAAALVRLAERIRSPDDGDPWFAFCKREWAADSDMARMQRCQPRS